MDDEQSICDFFHILFRKLSSESSIFFEVRSEKNGKKALELLNNKSFDMVICDLKLPDISGLELLKQAKVIAPLSIFLIVTSFDSSKSAVQAIKMGAFDYILKPFNVDNMKQIILSAFSTKDKKPTHCSHSKTLKEPIKTVQMIGASSAIQKLHQDIKQISDSIVNVLITGESGTGKEVVARLIHHKSTLKQKPFIAVNCGAISENLIESELFGHVKGAFTGAICDKKGFFEMADTGTLFLDEIGELSLSMQPKLLRALQEKIIRRVGATESQKVDIRLITATNRNLEDMVQEGSFREDLFYRLNVIHFHLPALRERREDIPLLLDYFLKKHCQKLGRPKPLLSQSILQMFQRFNYPGNVRELENMVERIMVLGDQKIDHSTAILSFLQDKKWDICPSEETKNSEASPVWDIALPKEGTNIEQALNQIEKCLLEQALEKTKGHRIKAAQLLHLSPRAFRHRLSKLKVFSSPLASKTQS